MIRNVNLTLLIGPTVPLPAPRPVLDALQSVEVTTATGSASGFQLTFAVANDSPLHTILLLAANANPSFLRVILIVTVNGTPDVLADGVIERQEITPGEKPGMSTLTVSGKDLTLVMDQ